MEDSTSHRSLNDLIGFQLKRDLYNDNGLLVLKAKDTLTEEGIRRIIKHGIQITHRDIEKDVVQTHTLELIEDSVHQVEAIFFHIRKTNKIPMQDFRDNIFPVINQATDKLNMYTLLNTIKSKDDYTYRHNIGVGMLATMIGKWMNLNAAELNLLTVGATLHDVGKMQTPEEILNKTGRLTDNEFTIMKRHTTMGHQMLSLTEGLPERVALIALQHHEREDGSGYPLGIKSDQIDPLSKIVSVADVFHALTSNRVYRNATPFYQILRDMHQGTLGKFDHDITAIFTHKIMSTLVGNNVVLTDGRIGKVVMINQLDPVNPLVQIDKDFLDLGKHADINMAEVIG